MKTPQIYVNGEEQGVKRALEVTAEFASQMELTKKESAYLRLITEELLTLFAGITNSEYRALFWIIGEGRKATFHLIAKTEMTAEKREQFLETASSGKNDAAVGIMGKIKDMVEAAVLNFGKIPNSQNVEFYDAGNVETAPVDGFSLFWTLENYRKAMENQRTEEPEDDDIAWEELERSIIANIADDVHVSIRKDAVELLVYKTFA